MDVRSDQAFENSATESHSLSGCLLNPFRIPSPFDLDGWGSIFDGTEVFRCKVDVRRSEVFFKAMQLGCAWNRNNHGFLASSQASAS
jgi:hypothetical protein